MAPSGAQLGWSHLPGTPELGWCVWRVGGSVRGSEGGQWVAAMQGEISPSSLEQQTQVGELGVPPWLSCQPMAPVPSARHVLLSLLTPLLARHAAMARGDVTGR